MIARVRPRKMEGKRGEKAGISGKIARVGKYSRIVLVKRGKISYNILQQIDLEKGERNMDHQILIDAEVPVPEGLEEGLRRVITAALAAEGVALPCEISVLLTDDVGIRQVNADMRNIDRATDVLSFPMFELTPGQPPEDEEDLDPETGLCPLGDMCISLERAAAQAREYGHSLEREVSYLAVHSVLHLLGYDHLDEGPMKRQMREREEAILNGLGIRREE